MHAYRSGMSLTMACDLIVAAEFGGLEEAGLGWILFFSRTLGTRGNTGSEGSTSYMYLQRRKSSFDRASRKPDQRYITQSNSYALPLLTAQSVDLDPISLIMG